MTDDIRHALPSGCRLDEYEFIQILGHGGFGVTYLARDVNLGKEVAIKEYFPTDLVVREDGFSVHPRSASMEDDYTYGLERFLDEARTLAKFRHPNIVVVHRFFRANGTAYLVMDYEQGEQLGTILHTRRTLPEDELLATVLPLLDGLEEVHKAGILHRDIKPENIYIRENGTPVLIDFGAARQALSNRSKTLTAVLTPGYAPFEQYFSGGDQGPWTDIYSMACVLYRVVTGNDPVESPARMDNDAMEPASAAAMGRYKKHFLNAIEAGMAVKPADRPQTVGDFANMLMGVKHAKQAAAKKAAAAAPGAAAAASVSSMGSAGRRLRGKIPLGAVAGGAALLVAGIGIAAWLGSGPVGPPQQATTGNTGAAQAGTTGGSAGGGSASGSGATGSEADRLAEERRKIEDERARLEAERARLESDRREREKARSKAKQAAGSAPKPENKPKPTQQANKPKPKKAPKRTEKKRTAAEIDAICGQRRQTIVAKFKEIELPEFCKSGLFGKNIKEQSDPRGCAAIVAQRDLNRKRRQAELDELERSCQALKRGEEPARSSGTAGKAGPKAAPKNLPMKGSLQ